MSESQSSIEFMYKFDLTKVIDMFAKGCCDIWTREVDEFGEHEVPGAVGLDLFY